MAKYEDILAANPEAFAEHEKKVMERASAEAAKKAQEAASTPATLAQLKELVPANMAGRSDLLVELQEKNATQAQAFKIVTEKLAAQNAEQQKKLAEKAKVEAGLGGAGGGVPALRIAGANLPGSAMAAYTEYQEAVAAETEAILARDPKLTERAARCKALTAVSDKRPDLLEAEKVRLTGLAKEKALTRKMG